MFFFEKKNQKTFHSPCNGGARETAESPKRTESFFASFCSQKEVLSSLPAGSPR
jgi:hypothetical protein